MEILTVPDQDRIATLAMSRHRPPSSAHPATSLTAAQLQSAVQLHQAGRLADAIAIYRQILKAQPKHFDAAQLLALATAQAGDPAQSVDLFRAALKIRPDDLNVLNNFSAVLIGLQRHADAIEIMNQALARNRNAPGLLNNLGVALLQLGRADEACAAFDEALALTPDFIDALVNRASATSALGRHDAALASADAALSKQPRHAAALSNKGLALTELGRAVEGLASIDASLGLNPNDADAHNNRGTALVALGRETEAIASYDRALVLRPDFLRTIVNRAGARQRLKRLGEALADCDLALRLAPHDPDMFNLRGLFLFDMARNEDAIASYDRALALAPGHVEALSNRGMAHLSLQHHLPALADFDRVIEIQPDRAFLAGHAWHLRQKICDWAQVDAGRAALIHALAHEEKVTAPFPSLLLNDPQAERHAADIWMDATCTREDRAAFAAPRRPGRIRLAYFSPDFRDHPVMMLTAGMFEAHDRETFETFAFSFGPPGEDPVRQRASAAFDHFIDIRTLTDTQAADLARSHSLDIAIDLAGFTQGCRPGLFARRVAPLQVGFLGYPGTMGAGVHDYFVADTISLPESSQLDFSEKVIRLPHTFQPNDRRPEPVVPTRAACGLPETGFVFCCFSNTYKITPEVFSIWMRILERVPGSILWLYAENDLAEANLKREAETRGIDPARLHFARRTPSFAEHLGRYAVAGLFLDTLPYNAHTTASDALWAGLPLLTRTGPTFAGRVAASVLTTAGLPDLVTHTLEAYEDLAVAIASDPEHHATLRNRTRTARNSPLFHTLAYTRRLETALRTIHTRHLQGLAPDHVSVQD